ncbi:MAG: hypothetical protein IT162_08695 [Bryobacterales bacterium]|nr:hypothetical protein [Bryobacterales bacterium]
MSMRNELLIAALTAAALGAQTAPADSSLKVRVNLGADSPVSLLGNEWDSSRVSDRGGAQVLHLAGQLLLKNGSNRHIRGVSWLVQTRDNTPGGRASVTKASLDVAAGETFPLKVELRLLRPLAVGRAGAPEIEVALDGVLFDNLSFYGPNLLDSRRVMVAFEAEAQRDRRHFLSVLQAKGAEALRAECMTSLARQSALARADVQMARRTTTTASEGERRLEFAFLRFPDSPVEAFAGAASVLGAEARAPRVEVANRSTRAVNYIEVGWLVRDGRGREYLAGAAVPSRTKLAPGQKAAVAEAGTLRFSEPAGGAPVAIDGMTAFVSQVEFADGSVWVPSRAALADPGLEKAIAPSAEEQRLTNLYRRKGLNALIDELKRFGIAR